MNKDKFLQFYKGTINESGASDCFDEVKLALEQAGIYSSMTMIGAMATVRVEVGKAYKPINEIASGKAYEMRASLGNFVPGDGVKYKGRGYIQLTGRNNYTAYGRILGIDLICNPEQALIVKNSANILALYFKNNACHIACNNQDWVKVRRLVNGGSNGLDTFTKVIRQFLTCI